MTGISGAMPSELRARIAAIQSRFDPATTTPTGSTAPGSTASLFQSLLTRAVDGGSTPTDDLAGTGAAGTASTGSAGTGAAGTAGSTPSAAGLGNLATDPTYGKFATDALDRLGMPKTTDNLAAMVAWAKAEGTNAANNPLATTQRMGAGETSFNSAGVKNYPSYDVGLDATVRTLRNGRYDEVLAALSRGNSAQQVGQAVAASPWGTGEGVLRVLGRA